MLRQFIILAAVLLSISFSFTAYAQPALPDIVGVSEKGINVISWVSRYDGVKSIAVQRSADSVFNYATVGYVKNLKKGTQAFIDGHPLPGSNWYRLYIVFNSDLTWYSNRMKLNVDSLTLINKGVLPPNDSLQKLASKIKVDTAARPKQSGTGTPPANAADSLQNLIDRLVITIPDPSEINTYSYVKSQYVFTNPFTGHINMELPDIGEHMYSIKFFDSKDKKVLEVPRVPESPVIIDKRNFQKKGLYRFELVKDKEKLESGYITVY